MKHVSLSSAPRHGAGGKLSIKKLLAALEGKRKLSLDAKNSLALLAGFQSWHDLQDAIHGDADASVNY